MPTPLPAETSLLQHRIIEVPGAPDGDKTLDAAELRGRMLPTLAMASAAATPVAAAWVRRHPHQKVEVFVGGVPDIEGASYADGRVSVAFPLGAVARRVSEGLVAKALGSLPHWVRCEARFDVLAAKEASPAGRLLDDFFGLLAHHPLGWLVVGRPRSAHDVAGRLEDLSMRVAELESQRHGMGSSRIEMERADAELRYLEQWSSLGFWDVEVWVGGYNDAYARAAAGLLSSSTDLAGLPVRLRPRSPQGTERRVVDAPWTSTLLTSTEVLAALIRPPCRELPGVRRVVTPSFDITPESNGPINLAQVLDETRTPCGPLNVSTATLNRHAFISGATGSGKSQTTRWLLEQLASSRPSVPWMVIEPAKAEYARMAGRLAGRATVVKIRPGELDAAPALLNPLEPASGFPLQGHLDLMRALFLAAFEADEPFPQVLSQAMATAYREAGWDLVSGEHRPVNKPRLYDDDPVEDMTPRYPRLVELQSAARRVVDRIGYGKEVAANVRGFIDVRLGSLCFGAPSHFFQDGHPIDIEEMLRSNVVIELEGITDDSDKAFVMGVIIIRIIEHLRLKYGEGGSDKLQHVIVIEEAHRLLKRVQRNTSAAAVELFASLLAEIRAYGEGVIVVEQIPSKIVADAIKNTALKVMHRLPATDDREAVGGTMNLTDQQSRAVVAFPPGIAAVAVDGMDRPVLAQVQDGSSYESAEEVVSADRLLARRSRHCAGPCLERACTLRQINDARYQAQDDRLLIWVEAITISYITGLTPPVAIEAVRQKLAGLSDRMRACVVAHAVERTVSARRSLLRAYYDPTSLEDELRIQLTGHLLSRAPIDLREYRSWLAGPYRYLDVGKTLKHLAESDGCLDAITLSSWQKRGVRFQATRPQEQLEELLQLPYYSVAKGAVVLGDVSVSGLQDSLLELGGGITTESVGRALRQSCQGVSIPTLARYVTLRLEVNVGEPEHVRD